MRVEMPLLSKSASGTLNKTLIFEGKRVVVYTAPVVESEAVQNWRSNFKALAQTWKLFFPSLRYKWSMKAKECHLTGYQLFIKEASQKGIYIQPDGSILTNQYVVKNIRRTCMDQWTLCYEWDELTLPEGYKYRCYLNTYKVDPPLDNKPYWLVWEGDISYPYFTNKAFPGMPCLAVVVVDNNGVEGYPSWCIG